MPVNAVEKWDKSPLAANLRAERRRLKLRSAEVAAAVGIDQQTLLRFEQGDFISIKPQVLIKLALILGKSPNDLLGYRQALRQARAAQEGAPQAAGGPQGVEP